MTDNVRNSSNWIILDWANNTCFNGIRFKSFDDAECFLCEQLDKAYEDERGEYYIEEHELILV